MWGHADNPTIHTTAARLQTRCIWFYAPPYDMRRVLMHTRQPVILTAERLQLQ